MLIQCTKKLLDQLNLKPESAADEEPLFSWHANLLNINRRKTVVLVNDKNKYVVVLYGLKVRDFKKLDELIPEAIRETLRDECIKDDIIDEFINHSRGITYARTKDKASVARMNKGCTNVYFYGDLLDDSSIYQGDVSIRASGCLVKDNEDTYIRPDEEMYKDLESLSGKTIFGCEAAMIKVTLMLENHNVWRRILVPLSMTFTRFHKVMQDAFGWKDYHLHEFYILDNESPDHRYSSMDNINHPAYNRKGLKPVVNLVCSDDAFEYPNDVEMKLEDGIKLSAYIPKYKNMKYNYDFGDNWQHFIEVEKVIGDFKQNHPVCIEGSGNTPPEDVGGEGGYEEFLSACADEDNPDHENMVTWGEGQGYIDFDIEKVNRMLKCI